MEPRGGGEPTLVPFGLLIETFLKLLNTVTNTLNTVSNQPSLVFKHTTLFPKGYTDSPFLQKGKVQAMVVL